MNEETERLKRDLQVIENAVGLNLWTRRDVRRGLIGVLSGSLAGLFLAIWAVCNGNPLGGLLFFLAMLTAVIIAKGVGFNRQPAQAAGSHREIAFYNRFYTAGGALVGCFFIWARDVGMDPLLALAITIVMAGSWYLFYAISAPSRWTSLGGALPLIACGFLLGNAHNLSQAICWIGIAACVGCGAEAVLLFFALRPPYSPPSDASPSGPKPVPTSPIPGSPLCDATH